MITILKALFIMAISFVAILGLFAVIIAVGFAALYLSANYLTAILIMAGIISFLYSIFWITRRHEE